MIDGQKPISLGDVPMNTVLKASAFAALAALATGCANTKALEGDVASLKTQVSSLQADVSSLKTSSSAANQTATDAQRAAQAADAKADQALATAQSANQKADANSQSMERMFAKAVSK
jgi:murein lipoprotein